MSAVAPPLTATNSAAKTSAAALPSAARTPPVAARASRLLLRLLLLAIAFAALPVALHGPFERADAERRAMLLRNAQDQASVVVTALAPMLDRRDPRSVERINRAARAYADDGTTLRIVNSNGATDAPLLVAAIPPVADRDFAVILQRLREAEGAGLDRARCTGSSPLESRLATVDGDTEILGAAAMSGSPQDCWTVLIGWRSAPFLASSLGRPYWETPEMRMAAIGYLALFALCAWMLFRAWRDARGLAAMGALAARRGAADAAIAPQPTVLSTDQETSMVATLREAAQAAAKEPPAPASPAASPAPSPAPSLAPGAAVPPAATRKSASAAAVADEADATEVIELRKQVADRVFDLHDSCTRQGLSLSYEALHPVNVRARAEDVDRVVAPLLQRALAASRAGDVLRVALRIGDEDARIHVEDAGRNANGVVMPPRPVASAADAAAAGGDASAALRAAEVAEDPILIAAARDLAAIGGSLDALRLQSGALRVTARFPLADVGDASA